jgi:hypothetical protein
MGVAQWGVDIHTEPIPVLLAANALRGVVAVAKSPSRSCVTTVYETTLRRLFDWTGEELMFGADFALRK